MAKRKMFVVSRRAQTSYRPLLGRITKEQEDTARAALEKAKARRVPGGESQNESS